MIFDFRLNGYRTPHPRHQTTTHVRSVFHGESSLFRASERLERHHFLDQKTLTTIQANELSP